MYGIQVKQGKKDVYVALMPVDSKMATFLSTSSSDHVTINQTRDTLRTEEIAGAEEILFAGLSVGNIDRSGHSSKWQNTVLQKKENQKTRKNN